MPLLHTKSPDLEEIIKVCKFGPEPEKLIKQKPLRIQESATFVVNQGSIGLKHPYDLDADDTRDRNGCIIAGTYNERTSKGWKPKTASMKKLHDVFRRRAVHKETLEKEGSAEEVYNYWRLIRIVPFVRDPKQIRNYKYVYLHLFSHFDGCN